MPDTNRRLLLSAARLLKPLLDELVFVGGCATGLLITDHAAASVRQTFDVDAIAEIVSYSAYVEFGDRLRQAGFAEDASEGAPVCRWKCGSVLLDIMPLDQTILGFSNRWYREAMNAAEALTLEPALRIRHITAPYFLATKLEAFNGRGGRDFFSSHDLEDLLSVIDGRPEPSEEVRATRADLRDYLALAFTGFLRDNRFIDALPGHMLPDAANAASQSRIPVLLKRIDELARQ